MAILSNPFDLPRGRLLALDAGEARNGLAVCDELGLLASPLATVPRARTRAEDFVRLAQVAARERAVGILVGLPLDSTGQVGTQARRVQRYARFMARELQLPIAFWDESFSTMHAAELLRASGGRTPIDAAAAAVILADFLEARRGTTRE